MLTNEKQTIVTVHGHLYETDIERDRTGRPLREPTIIGQEGRQLGREWKGEAIEDRHALNHGQLRHDCACPLSV